uniref:DUF4371 domain-containing protein n=1 Tax=Amphimedon queenslandica TaxID=400682 RepID=A0A1X7V1J2_AMPQE
MSAWKDSEKHMASDQSIGLQLDRIGAKELAKSKKYVSCLMEAILYCAQQDIAFRGHDESDESPNQTCEVQRMIKKEHHEAKYFTILVDETKDLDLDPKNLMSQCYDGASVMSGCNAGVQTLIRERYPQAIYVHCYAHRLNLVLVDVAKKVHSVSNFFTLLQSEYVFLSSFKTH